MRSRSKKIQEEFLEVYDEHADAVFRFCYFKSLDHDLSQEVMQEAFTRTWKHISDGKDIDNIRAFVYRVARNTMIDIFRKKKEASLDSLMEKGFDAGIDKKDTLEANMDGQAVLKVIGSIDIKYREVLVLRYIDDLSVKEIAKIQNKSPNHISVWIHRGLQQLRKVLESIEKTKKT